MHSFVGEIADVNTTKYDQLFPLLPWRIRFEYEKLVEFMICNRVHMMFLPDSSNSQSEIVLLLNIYAIVLNNL